MKNEFVGNYINLFKCPPRYKFLKPLGKGAYGYVVSAYDTIEKKSVAIKKISNLSSHLICTRTLREIRLLKHFRDTESIIFLHTCVIPDQRDFNDVYLVIELMEADLHHIIYSNQSLTIDHVKYLTFQLFTGLKAIHSAGVIHRDLKPANCLVNQNCQLKICDFGLAREGCDDAVMTNYVQTRWYRAPELLFGEKNYDSKVDIWSAGCIFSELLLRKPLFAGKNTEEQIEILLKIRGKPKKECIMSVKNENTRNKLLSSLENDPVDLKALFLSGTNEAIELIDKILEYDKNIRPSSDDALNHKFFKGYNTKTKAVENEDFIIYKDIVDDQMSSIDLRKEILFEIIKFYDESTIEKTIQIDKVSL